jgi:hypothetical protein
MQEVHSGNIDDDDDDVAWSHGLCGALPLISTDRAKPLLFGSVDSFTRYFHVKRIKPPCAEGESSYLSCFATQVTYQAAPTTDVS